MKPRGLKKETIKANWEPFARRPTWSCVSSRELAVALNVSLQSICNWRLRGILPACEPHSRVLNGNKNYYRISKIRAWLENRTEESIHWEWVERWIPASLGPIHNLAQVETVIKVGADIFGVEKSLIPGNFTTDQRNPRIDSLLSQGVDKSPVPYHPSGDAAGHQATL